MSEIKELIEKVRSTPASVQFGEVLDVIENNYLFNAVAFKNGEVENKEGQNSGSCKLLAFAKANSLSQEETLHLFGDYYRKDVLAAPEGTDHQNIRNFMKYGWDGVSFDGEVLRQNRNID